MYFKELNDEFYTDNKDECDEKYNSVMKNIKDENLKGKTDIIIVVTASDGVINNVVMRLQDDDYRVTNVQHYNDGKQLSINWRVY